MMSTIYIFFFVIIVIFELKRKKSSFFDLLTVFNFFFLVFFCITPFFIIIKPELLAHTVVSSYILYNPMIPFIILIAYILFVVSYKMGRKNIDVSNKLHFFKIPVSRAYQMKILYCVWGLSVIFIVLLLLFAKQRGGIRSAIEMADFYRSGTPVIELNYVTATFYIFTSGLRFVLILITYALFAYKNDFILKFITFFVVFCFTVIAGMMMGGRLNMLLPFIFVFITIVCVRQRFPFLISFLILIIFYIITIYGKVFQGTISRAGSIDNVDLVALATRTSELRDSKFYTIIGEFSPMVAGIGPAAFNTDPNELQYFRTIPYSFIQLIPTIIRGNLFTIPEDISYLATSKVMGATGFAMTYPGIIGFGFFNMTWIGFVFTMVLWGYICGIVDRYFLNNWKYCAFQSTIYISLCYFLGMLVFWGHPYPTSKSVAILLFLSTIFFFFRNKFFLKEIR